MALDYQDSGSGPLTLVLLPGWCEPKTVFEPFIALAAERYRVIGIDWRGHGRSSKAAGMSLAADDLLEDVCQLLTALRLDKVITLSVAHASWLAVALAEALPQRVRGMVFLDWIMTPPEPAFFTAVSRMQQPQQPFFSVMRLGEARTHLGILERPDAVLWAVEAFLAL
ncbi:alpha/beta hydrolase [Serratia nevei]|uniref:alpha/beta fold hydrolase n=1 Tax=Serratia nevei TaxID=2703794 RepID=UPI00209FF3BE|nr:alpha/beta fold hydrolase [Serratia nevei]MCP1108393.1 alpha/beta hydrolase [Serratia nevei]